MALCLEKTAHGRWDGPLGTLLQPSCLETQGEPRSVFVNRHVAGDRDLSSLDSNRFFYAVIFFHPLNTALSTVGSKSRQAEQDLNH